MIIIFKNGLVTAIHSNIFFKSLLKAMSGISDKVSGAAKALGEAATAAKDKVFETASSAGEAAKNLATAAKDKIIKPDNLVDKAAENKDKAKSNLEEGYDAASKFYF